MSDHRSELAANDPDVFAAVVGEERRQSEGLELVPSESYTYPEVLAALGSVFTNKYSEGYPGRRYYGGQTFTDAVERLAIERACSLFRAEHANVQPLSGSPMNQAVYLGMLAPGDTILGMDLSHGGHLTHGAPVSHMGKLFRFVRYKTRTDRAGAIDFDELRAQAIASRPKLILCGHSSYPRELPYAKFKAIADEVGALTMADVSHLGGLIAAGVLDNPMDAGFDFVTTTTHKSLRGPRSGLILCRRAREGNRLVRLPRLARRPAYERHRRCRDRPAQSHHARVSRLRRDVPRQRARDGRGVHVCGCNAHHGRHRESPHRHRHRAKLRPRRS